MDLMTYVPHFTEAPNTERAPVIEHKCRQPVEQDELMNLIKGNSLWAKLQRWFLRQRIVYPKHPLARLCLKSTTAVNYEISRHLKSHPYMIHPFSSFRIIWESFMTVFTFIALVITPFSITFYFEKYQNWHLPTDTMNIVFVCDIITWFFTGYYDYGTKVVVLDPKIVARKYIRWFFVIDILTVLPIGVFDVLLPKAIWYCSTFNMMKILRIRNIIVYFRRLHDVYRISFQVYKILETTIVISIGIHWAACMEYYVPLSVEKLGTISTQSWIRSKYFINKETTFKRYLLCLNRAIIAMVRSSHYSSIKTPEDIILNLILTILGFIGIMYLLTQFSQLMTTFHITIKRHLKIIQQLQEYMRYKELPHSLQRRLLIFYHYRNKRGFERDTKIINEVSPYLREQLILHNYLRLIGSVKLFNHLPKTVLAQLTSVLRSEIYMTNDEIVKAGTRGEALYFISSGTVAVYNSTGKEVCHLEDGTYFGEIALVMDSEHRIATVIAVETCEICLLHRDDFHRFISPYPDLLNRLQNVAFEHLKHTLTLDETSNLETSAMPQYINISSIKSKRNIDHTKT
ncbi:potassium/sodium hyperpolarization-activated cyclic nucleotide-gated channel 1-like [Osmia bicornis bicornis]|uniref:potassium/sodium hyperpolarization-activated cyclic nucleotide-gated channel 1-like n=1 Tax=Osmia bicornis bicornis TaxID=1437191 RepID=UPI0010F58500|nr:potassium/sodium hyperpolarization-activated cyclic nucleotide-gated channel 1-like [Osmia bicornis bicornis]